MPFKITILSTSIWTNWTWKWFFSSMCTNMILHVISRFWNSSTKWTCKFPWTNFYCGHLQWNSDFVFIAILIQFQYKLWIFAICCLRLLLWLQANWQIVQENGFSPVWVLIWRQLSLCFFEIFEQNGQANWPGAILIGSICKETMIL